MSILDKIAAFLIFMAFCLITASLIEQHYIIKNPIIFIGNHWEGILALCAITITIIEIKSTQRHNKLSVKPKLDSDCTLEFDKKSANIALILKNSGIGPAEILSYRLVHKGKTILENDHQGFVDYMHSIIPNLQGCDTGFSTLENGNMLVEGEQKTLVKITFATTQKSVDTYKTLMNEIGVIYQYADMYKNLYEFDTRNTGRF